jgi:hypothetical protein
VAATLGPTADRPTLQYRMKAVFDPAGTLNPEISFDLT